MSRKSTKSRGNAAGYQLRPEKSAEAEEGLTESSPKGNGITDDTVCFLIEEFANSQCSY